jgi:hypothetical protein
MTPVVSVVIPSHRPQYRVLAEASVDAQTFGEREMIVRASPLWWDEKINDAVRTAVGEYVVVLGDDDLLLPTFLEKAVAKAREGFDIVVTDCETFSPTGGGIARFGDFSREAFRRGNPVWFTSLFRRDLFLELRGFDMTQLWFDYDFWYRCFKHDAAFGHVREVLWRHREGHEGKGTTGVDAGEALRLLHAKHPELARVA